VFALYNKGLDVMRKHNGDSNDRLGPSWAEPELLMSLVSSSLNRTSLDLNGSRFSTRTKPCKWCPSGTTSATF